MLRPPYLLSMSSDRLLGGPIRLFRLAAEGGRVGLHLSGLLRIYTAAETSDIAVAEKLALLSVTSHNTGLFFPAYDSI
jgi:hypothetical protein